MEDLTEREIAEIDKIKTLKKASDRMKINLIILGLGMLGFFLPWVSIRFLGFTFFNLNGWSIPELTDSIRESPILGIGGRSYGTGVNLMYLIFLIPISIIIQAILEYSKKNKFTYSYTLNAVIFICLVYFFLKFFIETGMEGFQYLGIGPFFVLGMVFVLAFRTKKHQ